MLAEGFTGGFGFGLVALRGVISTVERSQPQVWPFNVPSQKISVTGRSVVQFGQSLIIIKF
ncbi:hypothetical protein BE61_78630 [Bradyrhizobium elkanii USDA 61]|nr:hypothetical protein BE61_78630 [Bradyrhizobium elkanii USDA 61]